MRWVSPLTSFLTPILSRIAGHLQHGRSSISERAPLVGGSSSEKSTLTALSELLELLRDWYEVDVSDHALVHRVLDDLRNRDELIGELGVLERDNRALRAKNVVLEAELEQLRDCALRPGLVAPLLKKARHLALLIGLEAPPTADSLVDLLDQTRVQYTLLQQAARAQAVRIGQLERQIDEQSEPE